MILSSKIGRIVRTGLEAVQHSVTPQSQTFPNQRHRSATIITAAE